MLELPKNDDDMGDMPPMPPMPPMGADPMNDPMGGGMDDGSLDNEGDEISPKKSMQQLAGKLSSEMRNYLDTADPEDAKQDALWVIKMITKAGIDVLDNKGKKSVIKTIKGQGDEDFNGLDDSADMADDIEAEEDIEADNAGESAEMDANMQMGM